MLLKLFILIQRWVALLLHRLRLLRLRTRLLVLACSRKIVKQIRRKLNFLGLLGFLGVRLHRSIIHKVKQVLLFRFLLLLRLRLLLRLLLWLLLDRLLLGRLLGLLLRGLLKAKLLELVNILHLLRGLKRELLDLLQQYFFFAFFFEGWRLQASFQHVKPLQCLVQIVINIQRLGENSLIFDTRDELLEASLHVLDGFNQVHQRVVLLDGLVRVVPVYKFVDQKDVGLNDVKLALEVLVLRVDRLLRLGTAAV